MNSASAVDEPSEMTAPASADPATKRAQQIRQIRSGCGGCLVVIILLGMFMGGYAALRHGLRVGTLGGPLEGQVVMGRPEKEVDAMIWIAALTLMATLFAMSARKLRWAFAGIATVWTLSLVVLFFTCFHEFYLMNPQPDGKVALAYLWPRPLVIIDPRGTVATTEQELVNVVGLPTSRDYIVLEVHGRRYRSVSSVSVEDARRFLRERDARVLP